jgi:hypothetical protein
MNLAGILPSGFGHCAGSGNMTELVKKLKHQYLRSLLVTNCLYIWSWDVLIPFVCGDSSSWHSFSYCSEEPAVLLADTGKITPK